MYNARHSRFRFVDWQTGIHINVYERWSITYKYHLHMSPKRYFWYAGRLKSTVPSYDTQCLNEHLAIGRLPVTQRGDSVQFMCSICHKYIHVHWVPANMWRKERAVQVIKDRGAYLKEAVGCWAGVVIGVPNIDWISNIVGNRKFH